ncbi:MAG: glycosyltransferase [Pyrobaculum sp.]
MVDVSVVIPTRNEEKTIGLCIEKVWRFCKERGLECEVIVSDNSVDRTPEIARSLGARVVVPERLGYGNAYMRGLVEARGRYIVMGDGDGTYDFLEMGRLLEPLERGEADVVVGSRFMGKIMPGAMPWLHKIGNPLLTWLFNLAHGTKFTDTHGGLRAMTREAFEKMRPFLKGGGMEFAVEMLRVALRLGLRVREVPITYYPRAEGTSSKLHTFRDGYRHLKNILLGAPTLLLMAPGVILFILGLFLVLTWSPIGILPFFKHGIRTTLLGVSLVSIGYMLALLGVGLKILAGWRSGLADVLIRNTHVLYLAGGVMALLGLGYLAYLGWQLATGGVLPPMEEDIFFLITAALGVETLFMAAFLSMVRRIVE